MSSFHSTGRKILPAPDHADGQLRVNGFFRNAQTNADLSIRKAVQFSEGENLLATLRQGMHRLDEQFDFLGMTRGFSRIGPFIDDGQPAAFTYILNGYNALPTKKVEGGIARRGEEVGSRFGNGAVVFRAYQPGIRFLYQIIDILNGRKMPAQESSQDGLVGLHLLTKPAGLLCILRGHTFDKKSRGASRVEPSNKTTPAQNAVALS